MIDYDATLQRFFDEIIKFLNNRSDKAKDKFEREHIMNAVRCVSLIAANPKKYADYNMRVQDHLEADPRAFMPSPYDNYVFLLYQGVVNNMDDLNSEFDWVRSNSQAYLLNALKKIKYKNETNVFKDFYYPFLPVSKFAVQEKQNQK